MTVREFIKENRGLIDSVIESQNNTDVPINDEERRLWVSHDEYLYNLALRNGVKI